MEEERTIDRLRKFAKYAHDKGIVKGENSFEAYCDLSNKYISNSVRNGKGAIGSDIISRISERFPELNVKWLCTGKGNMINDYATYQEDYQRALSLISELEKVISKMAINDTNVIPIKINL